MCRRPFNHSLSVLAFLLLLACPVVMPAAEPKPVPKDAEPTSPDYARTRRVCRRRVQPGR